MVFAGIMFELKLFMLVFFLIPLTEIRHILSGDTFEIIFNITLLISGVMSHYLTRILKNKKREAEESLRRIRYKAALYNDSLEEEDFIDHALQHAEICERELSELLHIIKDSLYADGVHLFEISVDNPERPLNLRISTELSLSPLRGPVIFKTGIIQRVAEEGIPRLVTFDSKGLTPGYASNYEINTLLAVPVMERKVISGVLAIDSVRRHAFYERDVEIAERFASLLSLTITRELRSFQIERSEKIIRLLQEKTARLTKPLNVGSPKPFFEREMLREEDKDGGMGCRDDSLLFLIDEIIESCHSISPSSTVAFILKESERFRIARIKVPEGSEIGIQIKPNFVISNPFYSLISEDKKYLYLPEIKRWGNKEDFTYLPFQAENAKSLLAIPLWYEHELLGLIVMLSDRPDAYRQELIEVMRVYANQAAIALKNAKLYEEVKNMATTDGLTGLFNHRKFHEELDRELKRHERSGRPLSLCLCDIDFFKKINDTYGHPAGDAVLKGVAGIIKDTLRSTDIAARYGGEEFAIILIDSLLNDAKKIAERLRRDVESCKFSYRGTNIKVTLSIGIATSSSSERIPKAVLIERADKALYYAKQSGRNRTVLWDELTDVS